MNGNGLSLMEAFLRWAEQSDTRRSTIHRYRRSFATVERHGITLLAELTSERFAEYLDARRREGRSPRTLNVELGAITVVVGFLVKRKLYPRAGLEELLDLRVRCPRPAPPDYYTRAEFDELARVAGDMSEWFGLAFQTAVFTGVRRGELRRIDREDLDLERRLLFVRRKLELGERGETKSGQERVVSLCSEFIELLRARAPRTGPLFPAGWGARQPYITREAMTIWMLKLSKATGIHCTWHRCRRTFVTWCLAVLPPPEVARMVGHTSLAVLYGHYMGAIRQFNPLIDGISRSSNDELDPAA